MTRKNSFGTKVLYRLLLHIILQYFVVVITVNYCLLNCCINLISLFNKLIFGGEKLKCHSSCDID